MTLDKMRRYRFVRDIKMRLVFAVVGAVLALVIVFFVFDGKLISISNSQSLELPEQVSYETTVKVDALLAVCGAQVEAEYAGFAIHKEHELLGKVYRTDTVSGSATTKVGVCVDVFGYVAEVSEEGVVVTVQPDSVRLLLPSVDHWQTQTSYNDGADIFSVNPLIAENNDLMDVTYMWLQLQATEGACVDVAWGTIIAQLKESIAENERVRGIVEGREISIDNVEVRIDALDALEAARERVLREIGSSGPRASYAFDLLRSGEEIRVDDESLNESCEVVTGT